MKSKLIVAIDVDGFERAAALGAYYNVLINLAGIKEKSWRTKTLKRADAALAQVGNKSTRLEKSMRRKLRQPLN